MNYIPLAVSDECRRPVIAFAKVYLDWVEGGAVENPVFMRHRGLCLTMQDWWVQLPGSGPELRRISDAMGYTWRNESTPFCAFRRYPDEARTASMHLNPLRMDWVRWAASGMPEQRGWWLRLKGWANGLFFKRW